MIEWMVRAIVAGALAGLAGLVLERVLRDRRLPARLVWLASLSVSVTVPVLALAAPSLWPATQLAVLFDLPVLAPTAAAPTAGAWAGNGVSKAQPNPIIGLWVLASAFLLLRYGWSWWRVHRVVAGTRAVHVAGAPVWLSSGLGPAAVGMIRPRIVIPSWMLALSEDRKRMVIWHEQEHLRRGDHWLLGLAPLLAVAFPWNASIWWQVRRLRRAVELDCDARVLRAGAPAQAYATLLLDVALMRATTGVLALSYGGSLVKERVQALLSVARPARRAHNAGLVALSVLLALAGLVAVLPDRTVVAQRAQSTAVPEQVDRLFVIDQTPVLPGQLVDVLVDRIVGLEEIDPATAVARYGAQARAGAVLISTVHKSFVTRRTAPARASIDLTVRVREPDNLSVLAGLIDVKRISVLGTSIAPLGSFRPRDIVSVQVLKGDAALLRLGPSAAQGAIHLVLRSDYFDRLRIAAHARRRA